MVRTIGFTIILLTTASAVQADDAPAELDATRLIGKAHYENAETPPQFDPAIEAFRKCLEMAPDSAIDHFNLGLCLMRGEHYGEALAVLQKALQLDPDLIGAHYVIGIVHKRRSEAEKAIEHLEKVIARDPECMGAFYNVGVCYKLLQEYEKAIDALNRAVELEPTHPSCHMQLMTLYRRLGKVDDVARHREIFDLVKDTVDESEKTAEALERSKYSYIIEAPKLTGDLEPQPDARVQFVEAANDAGLDLTTGAPPTLPASFKLADYDPETAMSRYAATIGGRVALADFDADGDRDLYVVRASTEPDRSSNRLLRNENGRFIDVTAVYGVGDAGPGTDAVFGDYDKDGHLDLYVVNAGPNVLYRKLGDGDYRLDKAASGGMPGVALLEPLSVSDAGVELSVDVTCEETTEGPSGGYLVFDYESSESFRFAGLDLRQGKWVIGHCDGTWKADVELEEAVVADQTYTIRLRLDGKTARLVVVEMGEDVEKLSVETRGAVTNRRMGLATADPTARFDNLEVRSLSSPNARPVYHENFKDGTADALNATVGSWIVADYAYQDVSQAARVQEPQLGRRAAFVDYDHDNDLDIFIVNGADLYLPPEGESFVIPDDLEGLTNTLLRNNGDGTFSDRTDEANLLVDIARSQQIVYTDVDADEDTDLFIVNNGAPSRLMLNARLGKFDEGGTFSPPLSEQGRAAVERDVNRDGAPDLIFADDKALLLYLNNGKAGFTGRPIELPPQLAAGPDLIRLLDYNNDGWSDLLLVGHDGEGLCLMAGSGPARFDDVSKQAGLDGDFGRIADVAVGDLDDDGDEDLVLLGRDGGLRLLRNEGGNQHGWIDVRLVGRKVNRDGFGALIEIASAGHYQKQTATEGVHHFGLGDLDRVDVVRVVWPNGQAQNVVRPEINTTVTIPQYVKVSASCGFLYAWDGKRFELINEILGIGPLGVPMAPGVYYPVDNTELTKIEPHELVPRDGRYELRLTEELNEITYADAITLRVIDHPSELEIIPNEMFSDPPPEDRFYAVTGQRPPVAAVDDRGRDVLDRLLEKDGRFPPVPRVEQYDGLAEPHSLTLDLGDLAGAERIVLFLDSWIYWPDSSVSMALGQDPRYAVGPLKLEVMDERGKWRTAIESVGLPTSKGIVVPVDLTGMFPADDYRVRLSTNLCIYFDRIFTTTRDEPERCRMTELPVEQANLHYRGFSRMTRDELGYERFDYHQASPIGSWSPPAGLFTRYGDVTELLGAPDNQYVIFGPGDEMIMTFDTLAVPDLPDGWTRSFVFYANGWVKDGDLNTKFSEMVEPLPFHGMSSYPYPPDEAYPDTPELRRYRLMYNTRRIGSAGPPLGRVN